MATAIRSSSPRPALLPPAQLGDLTGLDLPAYVGSILEARLRRWGADLTPEQYEDARSFLIETALVLYRDHDPAIGTFKGRLSVILPLRLVNWYRTEIADTRDRRRDQADPHEPERPALLETDIAARLDDDEPDAWLDHAAGGDNWIDELLEAESTRAILAELSAESLDTLRTIVAPIADGLTLTELGRQLNQSTSTLSRRIDRVRAEILERYQARAHGAAA